MSTPSHKNFIEHLLSLADIKINGERPWDIAVHNDGFYSRLISGGSLALGESYMDGWWDCPQIDQLIERIISAKLSDKIPFSLKNLYSYLTANLANSGSKKKAWEIGKRHYDLGNDLFSAMLDKRMVYTCGYWANANDLDVAQEAKLELVCKKLGLKKGKSVLDIGCGWGSFAKYAAEKYGARVIGVTVSKEQAELARKMCQGLPVEIRLQDYRDIDEKFDHIISLGMFEHVGSKNYQVYMHKAVDCLKDGGLFLLHTIGVSKATDEPDAWIGKYIFPVGHLPSISEIGKALENNFVMEDWHNFGADYGKTLFAWFRNFEEHWPALREKYGDRFYRMWKYYLLACAGTFRARELQLWQIVLSKKGVRGGYKSIR